MGAVTWHRGILPPAHLVAGLVVMPDEDAWWVMRFSTAAERESTGLWFQPVAGPLESQAEAERAARRHALRPVPNQEDSHE